MIPKAEVQTDSRLAARCAAIASAGAGLIHFAVMPGHWLDWIPSGLFFAAVAVFQLMWAFLVWSRPRPLLLAVGIVGNAGSAALWVASRTVGLPFGPHSGVPEGVEGAGICVLLLECYVIMGAGWAWLQDYEPEAVSRFRSALVMLGANGVIAGTVCVGVASGFQGQHDHDGPTEARTASHHDDQAPHQHREPVVAPNSPATSPPGSAFSEDGGLPVTDMGLHVPALEQERSDSVENPTEVQTSLDGEETHPADHSHD